MSPIGVEGPELVIGTESVYVALLRPEIDPTQPGVRLAAEQAGVTPEEFAGPGNIWALMLDVDGEGDGFELPGARDIEADDFAEQLQRALAAGEPFTAEAGNFLRLDARPVADAWQITASVTPPEGHDGGPQTLELGALPAAELLADLEDFRRALA
ncbi:hypothetical protein [Streptomyces sp. WM6372]|uniref:hypothetical protein n=1 Tax=Streptomyces sp. WM6372 TaxID=1415555 RepID=UPI0006B0598D|nr:hypothetical protein [Streptomyces sp. WM6372]